ncbi:MAG: CidA/LrgA family protein [Christensenellaceae bacterium]|nr:CidA/LrgA family protein [Christensenellaceae bacterium]
MKITKQLCIIFAICVAAEAIEEALPFAVPANMIGLGILLVLLAVKFVKKDTLNPVGGFLLSNMSLFFVPATVSIITVFDMVSDHFVQIIIICVVTTVITFAATAYTVKAVSRLMNRKEGGR